MRKQLLLLKSLLVAALLGVGTSAWAQVTTWTAAGNASFTCGQVLTGNVNGLISMQLGATSGSDAWGSNKDGYTSGGNVTLTDNVPTAGTFLKITPTKTGNLKMYVNILRFHTLKLYNSTNMTQTIWSARKTDSSGFYGEIDLGTLTAGNTYYMYDSGNDKNSGNDPYFRFKSFTYTTYENYTIHYQDGNGTTIKDDVVYSDLYGAEVTAAESDMASVEYNDKTYYYQSGNETITLGTSTNKITLVYASQTAATVTVKYWNNAEPAEAIRADATIDTYVGATNIAPSAEQVPSYITYNEKKYKYVSGNTSIAEVTGDATIDLVYTEADKYSYTVKGVDGSSNDLGTVNSGSAYEDETVTYYYPEFVLSGTTLYKKNQNGGNPYFGASGTLDADNKVFTVTYGDAVIDNVVFYAEAENISGFAAKTTNNATIRCSNGTGGIVNGSDPVKLTTLPAGKYKIIGQVWGTTGLTAGVTANDKVVWSKASTGSLSQETSSEFNLIASTDLYIYTTGGNDNHMLDFIYIQRTGDATTEESVTVGSAGFATYVPTYDLDFSSSTIEAYKVKVSSKGLATLTKVNEVPAGTPVLLYANDGATQNIPVITSADAVTDNDLVAGTTTTATDGVPTTDGDNTNMILNVVDKQIGFYFANNQTVATDRAYLHIASEMAPDAQTPSRMRIVFAGETTGVKSLPTSQKGEESVYNLAGQRVKKPTKGLYVKGGKKVIVK